MVINPEGSTDKGIVSRKIPLRWRYIFLPAVILLFSVAVSAFFYRLLPPQMAYLFKNGQPDMWMARGALIAWLIAPQFVLVLLGLAITVGFALMSGRFQPAAGAPLTGNTAGAPVTRILAVMGNIVAMPQIILTFIMLDLFLYNSYEVRLIPLWVFALIIMVLGGFIVGFVFLQTLRQLQSPPGKNLQEL